MSKPELVSEHEAKGHHIEIDGLRIFVREEGVGEPVLLLHGVPSSSFLYRKMMKPIADQGFRAIAFDFPGMGLSDKPRAANYDWHALAVSVGKVVDALDVPKVHLVVHDIGGPIGVEWAVENPDRVASITIMNTLLDVATFTPPFPMWTFRVPVLRHVAFAANTPGLMAALFRKRGVKNSEAIDHDVAESYLYLLRCNGGHTAFLDVMDGFVLTEAHRDYLRDGLLSVGAPLQLVWGEEENAIPKTQLDYICQVFPLKEQHMVNARHFLQEEQAEVCAAHICEFAKSSSLRGVKSPDCSSRETR